MNGFRLGSVVRSIILHSHLILNNFHDERGITSQMDQ